MLKFLKACHVRAKKETAVQRGHVQMHENLTMCKQDRVTPSLSLYLSLSLSLSLYISLSLSLSLFASALESTVYLRITSWTYTDAFAHLCVPSLTPNPAGSHHIPP